MAIKTATVGWQGITLKVPADWSLVGVSGDDKKGYFRVDGPIAAALEVRWSSAAGKPPDLMAKGREFMSTLEKSCKKGRVKFSSKIKPEEKVANSVVFQWKADRAGQGRLTYCPECDRVLIAQVISSKDENVSSQAPAILGSMKDHRDDGWVDWALYGLEFAVPASYRIEKQQLMSGYLSLAFKSRAKTLVVERWGLAGTLLGEMELEQWYRKDVTPDVKGYKLGYQDWERGGHPGLKITGRRGGIKMMAKAIVHAFTLHPHPGLYTGYAWHCEESNRLFSVRATHTPGDDVAERVMGLIECHRDRP